ncbi:Ferric/cupric reductase transmembrane component 1 [Mycena venus]|uniref:Ferric/cupric reductase transmembrane component 1 n=1 Tax=Mycena venus TaxID=2733690 RepID=A0A8H7CIZ7_9AGAR|nr:Ferric/cupric reductase transmembrane component 1 [Mycena venus]
MVLGPSSPVDIDGLANLKAQTVDPDRIPRITLANLYPKQVWYFMATFIGLVAACHVVSTLHAYLTRNRAPPPPRADSDAPLRHGVSWIRLPLATLNLFRTIAFRWSIVIAGSYTLNVADFLLAAMYLTVLFTWTFINSKNSLGKKYDPKYWANRCAHIAGSQLPLMTAFGMKNNFMSFLTGVSFDKMEHLHRVMARVICVMFWVHAFGRVVLVLSDDPTEYWFKIGVTGASALTLLCLLSVRPLRSRNYEAFMYLHGVLGVITLAGAYKHSAEFGYGVYIWPAMFLWGLDRFFRFVRITFVNSQLFKNSTNNARRITSDATVTVLSPHFLRILVDAPPYFVWRPGQSAYLIICGAYATSITEAHPFTIANAPDDGQGPVPTKDQANAHSEKESSEDNGNEHVEGASRKEGTEDSGSSNDEGKKDAQAGAGDSRSRLTFILRVREGFTKRLVDSVLANPDSNGVSRTFKAFVDGPYSSPPVVRGYETVVFICGGSRGFRFMILLSLNRAFRRIRRLIRTSTLPRSCSASLRAARANANPCCQRVVLVWAIRDPDQINWIAEAVAHALSTLPPRSDNNNAATPVFEIRLHVTTAPEDTQSFEGEERSSVVTDPEAAAGTVVGTDPNPGIAHAEKMDPTAKERLLAVPGVSLIYGRPDIKGILETEIKERAGGAVSVNVCGTTELAQSVRDALRAGITRFVDVLRGGPSVVLHVEGFGSG